MTATDNQFRVVMRGYDAAEVDRRISELTAAASRAQRQVEDLSRRLHMAEEAHAQALQQAESDSNPPSFSDLGKRVEKILALAEEEAAEIRMFAKRDLESQQQLADEAAERVRNEADTYAEQRHSEADAEAAKIIQEAEARLEEADTVYESQRAKAAHAVDDLERTLARRWEVAEQEFNQQLEAAQERLAPVQAKLEQMQAEVDRLRSDAEEQARQLLEDAEQNAQETVADATAEAERIRAESERELAQTIQRRDSINAQLTKVLKLMLATLSGAGAGAVSGDAIDEPSDRTYSATEVENFELDEIDALNDDEDAASQPAADLSAEADSGSDHGESEGARMFVRRGRSRH